MNYSWLKISNSLYKKLLEKEGAVLPLRLDGKRLFIVNKKGVFYAGNALCPHAKGPMDKAWLSENENCIVCPLHRFEFDLETGRSDNEDGFCLEMYPVKVENGALYLGLQKGLLQQFIDWFSN